MGWNSFGPGSSDVTTVTTSEDKPWGVAPPRWSCLSERDDIIQLQWEAPARPNGLFAHLHDFQIFVLKKVCERL